MEQFYYIVLIIAIIFLILVLVFIGIMMQSQNAGQSYPPVSNQCPDFWTLASDGSSCLVPGTQVVTTATATNAAAGTNVGVLPTTITAGSSQSVYGSVDLSNCGTLVPTGAINSTSQYNIMYDTNLKQCSAAINPSNSIWTANGLTAVCAQRQWASQVGVQWDGTSNYNGC
jgi:hypothetical protein